MATNTIEAIKIIAEYADQLDEADHLTDHGSLKAGKKAEELFEAGEWVEEWVEQKPPKPDATGRVPDPSNPNRFGGWLAWKLEQEGHRPLSTRHTARIMVAAKTANRLTRVSSDSERTIRPLNWLEKNGYGDRVQEVWQIAVDLADGVAEDVTSAHTTKALSEFKKKIGTKAVKTATNTRRATVYMTRAQADLRHLWGTGDEDEQRAFDEWYKKFRKGEPV